MTTQYETTRKRHWLWHKRLGDTWSFQVWQIVSGDSTGAYMLSSFGHTWKECDESDKLLAGDEDPGASVDPYLASESESYYRYLPDLSLAPQTFSPAPMLSVTRFVLKPEEISTFEDGLKKVTDAIRKTGYPLAGPIRWYQLATGGEGPQFLLLADRADWGEYEPPTPKTLDAMMEEVYGKEQGATILRAVRGAVRSEYVETWKYRSDLSFVPATSGSAQQTPVPVAQEPHHHVLLKNDSVEVIRATLQPGESTLFHIHSHESAGFSLLSSTTTEQLLGKPEQPASTSRVGEVYAESLSNGPYTHRVHNVGNGPMDEFHVELLQRPVRPSSPAAPVAAENASARVYTWVLAPGTVAAMHTHQRPYLIVAVTPLHLKMVAPDGKSQSDTVKPGDFHWVDAKVTHAFANEGGAEGQIVEIELK